MIQLTTYDPHGVEARPLYLRPGKIDLVKANPDMGASGSTIELHGYRYNVAEEPKQVLRMMVAWSDQHKHAAAADINIAFESIAYVSVDSEDDEIVYNTATV